MKYLIALLLIVLIFTMGRLTAQPRSLDDLVEFRADGIYAKVTWTMKAPYWPAYKINKGTRLLTIDEEQATEGE